MNTSAHDKITCGLCPHACSLAHGAVGLCRARQNDNGRVVSLSAGKITCIALDPIEKKPLALYKPNSTVLSIGSFGCNMRCPWCQNASIAQADMTSCSWELKTAIEIAERSKQMEACGCIGVAYTYNEPTTFYEFMLECCKLVKLQNQDNVLVSNGLIAHKPLLQLAPYIDAANIDLKCFDEHRYTEIGGDLNTVLSTIETLYENNTHVEVTTLIVPGFNDTPDEIKKLASWLAGIDRSIVLHLTRFFPRYTMRNAAPTPRQTLDACLFIAQEFLPNARLGNV